MNIERIAIEAGFTVVPTGIFAQGASPIVAIDEELYRFAEMVRRETLLEAAATISTKEVRVAALCQHD